MTKRAMTVIVNNGIGKDQLAIRELVNFASQNSGMNRADYGFDRNGSQAYREESRAIGQDWRRFMQSVAVAIGEGVTDKDVLAAAPGAYSGRLEWKGDHWNYCSGQYFATEYRKAAACVIESALQIVRRTRLAQLEARG